MKHFIKAVVLVAGFLAVVYLAEAQVYVPGGYPLCFPQTVAGPNGPITIVVCQ